MSSNGNDEPDPSTLSGEYLFSNRPLPASLSFLGGLLGDQENLLLTT